MGTKKSTWQWNRRRRQEKCGGGEMRRKTLTRHDENVNFVLRWSTCSMRNVLTCLRRLKRQPFLGGQWMGRWGDGWVSLGGVVGCGLVWGDRLCAGAKFSKQTTLNTLPIALVNWMTYSRKLKEMTPCTFSWRVWCGMDVGGGVIDKSDRLWKEPFRYLPRVSEEWEAGARCFPFRRFRFPKFG